MFCMKIPIDVGKQKKYIKNGYLFFNISLIQISLIMLMGIGGHFELYLEDEQLYSVGHQHRSRLIYRHSC